MRIYEYEGKTFLVTDGKLFIEAAERLVKENMPALAPKSIKRGKFGKRRRIKVTEEITEKIIKLRKDGKTIDEISEDTGISKSSISRIFKNNKIKKKYGRTPSDSDMDSYAEQGMAAVRKVECDDCGFTFETRQPPRLLKCAECQGKSFTDL